MQLCSVVHRVVQDRTADYDLRDWRPGTGRGPGHHATLLSTGAGAGADQPGRACHELQIAGRRVFSSTYAIGVYKHLGAKPKPYACANYYADRPAQYLCRYPMQIEFVR